MDFLDDEDDDLINAHVAEFVAVREVIAVHPIGTHRDIRRLDDGKLVGPGEEPSNRAINTGFAATDFQKGDSVLIWWWSLWWKGVVQYVARRDASLTVRFEWSNQVCTGYAPRLVWKAREGAAAEA